jgi:hypothetical protein
MVRKLLNKYFISILAIVLSVVFLNILAIADEDEFGDTDIHAAKRGNVVAEDVAQKKADKKIGKKALKSEINFITYDDRQSLIVHVDGKSKLRKSQKYTIQVVNDNDEDLYFYAFKVVGKKAIALHKNDGENIVYAGDALQLGDEPVQFKKLFKNKKKVSIYFFLSPKKIDKLESEKVSAKNVKKAYKKYHSEVYSAKLVDKRKSVDQFDKNFMPVKVWFKNKLALRLNLKSK